MRNTQIRSRAAPIRPAKPRNDLGALKFRCLVSSCDFSRRSVVIGRNFDGRRTVALGPCSVNTVDAATHECTVGAEEEGNNIASLFSCTLSSKRAGVIEWSVGSSSNKVPVLLHQRRVDCSWSNSIHSDLPGTHLLCSRSGQPNDTVFAHIISGMVCKP